MAINKVVYGNNTLMDITDTTATTNDVANGKVFYSANGTRNTGTASTGLSSYSFNIDRVVQYFYNNDDVYLITLTETEITTLNGILENYTNNNGLIYFVRSNKKYMVNIDYQENSYFSLSCQFMDSGNFINVVIDCDIYEEQWYCSISLLDNQYEKTANKVTEINDENTDMEYPSAKAVYDLVSQSGSSTPWYFFDITRIIDYFFNMNNSSLEVELTEDELNDLNEIYNDCLNNQKAFVYFMFHQMMLMANILFVPNDEFMLMYQFVVEDYNLNFENVEIMISYDIANNSWWCQVRQVEDKLLEKITNKTNIIDEYSTNDQYPTAPTVYDFVTNTATLSTTVRNIVSLTQAQYNALSTKDNETLYIIVG